MARKIPNIFTKRIPRLEIGEVFHKRKLRTEDLKLRELTDEEIKRGAVETMRVKGRITFISDCSKVDGTREMFLGDPIYRIGEEKLDADEVMFLPYEYFANKSDVD